MNFKDLRIANGYYKQEVLAKKLKISRTTISMWENGLSYPTVPTIHKIANLFNVEPTKVFLSFVV